MQHTKHKLNKKMYLLKKIWRAWWQSRYYLRNICRYCFHSIKLCIGRSLSNDAYHTNYNKINPFRIFLKVCRGPSVVIIFKATDNPGRLHGMSLERHWFKISSPITVGELLKLAFLLFRAADNYKDNSSPYKHCNR